MTTQSPPRIVSWRYALARETDDSGEAFWTIREVYLTADRTPIAWTGLIGPRGDTRADIRADLLRMARALRDPWLDLDADPPRFREDTP